MDEFRALAVCGFLGYGFPVESLEAGIARRPHIVGVDNGSSDPGPYYLGSGDQLTRRPQMVRDLGLSLSAARRAGLPYVIGSAGTAGGDPHVESVLEVLHEVSRRDGHAFKLAVIRAEIEKSTVKEAVRDGRVRTMGTGPDLTEEQVDESVRIVGQMGIGPMVSALEAQADVIVAGRACDTAIYACMAAMEGFDMGLAYHMAKIVECGAQCAIPAGSSDCILATLRADHFELEVLNPQRQLTPTSVAAHMLYEQPSPHVFHEPEGTVDLRDTEIEQIDDRRVRVWGGRFIPASKQTVKLEGARLCGYRAISVAGIVDPSLISHLDFVEAKVRDTVADLINGTVGPDDYDLRFLFYGRDGLSGRQVSASESSPREVCVVLEAIAQDQGTADYVLSLTRSSFLHCDFDGRKATAGNLAFPFSPSDIPCGPVYEFNIYHLMELEDASAPFSIEFEQVGGRVF